MRSPCRSWRPRRGGPSARPGAARDDAERGDVGHRPARAVHEPRRPSDPDVGRRREEPDAERARPRRGRGDGAGRCRREGAPVAIRIGPEARNGTSARMAKPPTLTPSKDETARVARLGPRPTMVSKRGKDAIAPDAATGVLHALRADVSRAASITLCPLVSDDHRPRRCPRRRPSIGDRGADGSSGGLPERWRRRDRRGFVERVPIVAEANDRGRSDGSGQAGKKASLGPVAAPPGIGPPRPRGVRRPAPRRPHAPLPDPLPPGPVAETALNPLLAETAPATIVVVSARFPTFLFPKRRRAGNDRGAHTPGRACSPMVDLVVRGVPVLLVATMAVLVQIIPHELDPRRAVVPPPRPPGSRRSCRAGSGSSAPRSAAPPWACWPFSSASR